MYSGGTPGGKNERMTTHPHQDETDFPNPPVSYAKSANSHYTCTCTIHLLVFWTLHVHVYMYVHVFIIMVYSQVSFVHYMCV